MKHSDNVLCTSKRQLWLWNQRRMLPQKIHRALSSCPSIKLLFVSVKKMQLKFCLQNFSQTLFCKVQRPNLASFISELYQRITCPIQLETKRLLLRHWYICNFASWCDFIACLSASCKCIFYLLLNYEQTLKLSYATFSILFLRIEINL